MTKVMDQTPLHDWHANHGGRMVDFAGWSMPVQYGSIVDEHHATRRAVGLFDISHMGRLRFDGADAGAFLDSLLTRRVDNLKVGQVRYSLMTADDGGILDDVLVYRLDDRYMLVVNASNREKIVAWLNKHLSDAGDVQLTDETFDTAMIAVQGPKAVELAAELLDSDPGEMKYYNVGKANVSLPGGESVPALVSRTGYTGEDGVELIVPNAAAVPLWQELLSRGESRGATPVGLGARDTLRLEAAMPLYGHELNEQITPQQAGLDFAVHLSVKSEDRERNFPGAAAMRELKDGPPLPCRVGLVAEGRRAPREGCAIVADGVTVGEVTSGTHSPTLEKPIAMAYVPAELSATGTQVTVDLRGKELPAVVVELPFYERGK